MTAQQWNIPTGTRVLVTGATGFTGSALTRRLLDDGCVVRVLARRPERLAPDLRGRAEIVHGDICDSQAVRRAVEGCVQVYHLAALFRRAGVPASAYRDVHVRGTEYVLQACAEHGIERLVHCSTMGVHGNVKEIPANEETPFNPGDEYQRSKLAAEELVRTEGPKRGVPFVIVRPAAIYGPGDMRFLKLFRAIKRGYFVMLGSGRTYYHLVYVDDLVDGMLRCAREERAISETFCLAQDGYVTLNEMTALIAETLGVRPPRWYAPVWPVLAAATLCEAICVPLRLEPPLHRRRVHFFTNHRAFNIGKARQTLGYQPEVKLREGLRRTADWYEQQGLL